MAISRTQDMDECEDLAQDGPRFTREVKDGSSRLRTFDYVGSSGRIFGGVFDTVLNTPCKPALIEAGTRAACIPEFSGGIWAPSLINMTSPAELYSDDMCTTVSRLAYGCFGNKPVVSRERDLQCHEPIVAPERYSSPVAAPLYYRTEQGCERFAADPASVFFDQVSEPATDLGEMTLGNN